MRSIVSPESEGTLVLRAAAVPGEARGLQRGNAPRLWRSSTSRGFSLRNSRLTLR
jgi:hypothetical protein